MEKHLWRILLVDDDEDDYILVREWLTRADRGRFELIWASSSGHALQTLERGSIDAVLVDYDLGVDTGLDFVRVMLAGGHHEPVIMLTGRGNYEVDLQAMNAGVSDFLGKNEADPQVLERSLRYAIERKKTEEALRRANDELEERIQERTQELIRKNEALVAEIVQRQRVEQELAEVRRRLLDRVEGERLELSRDLHDGPMQELYGLIYQAASLESQVGDQEIQQELASFQENLHQVIGSLRVMAGELRPPTLAPFGLEISIREHAEEFSQVHPDLQVSLDLMPDEQSLAEPVRLALFRIYQAALNNVARHAQAQRVDIRFRFADDEIVLEIQDDGRGFELPERWITLAREGHLGLVGAAERAEAVGGKLDVESAPGKGTCLRVIVPRERVLT